MEADEFREEVSREIADAIDKYGRRWLDATGVHERLYEIFRYYEEMEAFYNSNKTKDLADVFGNCIRSLDKTYNEIKQIQNKGK